MFLSPLACGLVCRLRKHHHKTLETLRSSAYEQVSFNVQGVSMSKLFFVNQLMLLLQYLDHFSRALATEVRMLLGEVGGICEETGTATVRLSLLSISFYPLILFLFFSSEIGELLCIKSKYVPGGEFEPDWYYHLPFYFISFKSLSYTFTWRTNWPTTAYKSICSTRSGQEHLKSQYTMSSLDHSIVDVFLPIPYLDANKVFVYIAYYFFMLVVR